jgi:GcrA cell cycle regulator
MYNCGAETVYWTAEAIETLTSKWAAGWSHSQIAALIPNATRSAIAGKIMRLKLPARDKGHASPGSIRVPRPRASKPGKIASISQVPAIARRNPNSSLAEKLAIADAEPGLPERLHGEKPDGTGVKLIDLNDSNCHFPKGDPREAGFEFCGARSISGTPYCAHHCRVSFMPAADRRRPTTPAY